MFSSKPFVREDRASAPLYAGHTLPAGPPKLVYKQRRADSTVDDVTVECRGVLYFGDRVVIHGETIVCCSPAFHIRTTASVSIS